MAKGAKNKKIFKPLFLFLISLSSLCKALGRKRKAARRRRPLFTARLLKRLYRAWQRGVACPSLVVLFILCVVQGVSNALGLCVVRETTHCILSSVPSWGMGRYKGKGPVQQRGGHKANLEKAAALQSHCAQRLIKRYFMQCCGRCNFGVLGDRESLGILSPAHRAMKGLQPRICDCKWACTPKLAALFYRKQKLRNWTIFRATCCLWIGYKAW